MTVCVVVSAVREEFGVVLPYAMLVPHSKCAFVALFLGLAVPTNRADDEVTFCADDVATVGAAAVVTKLISEPLLDPLSFDADARK